MLKALLAVPSRQPLEEIRALFSYHQAAVEATAQRFRLLLYLVSILLLATLVYLGLQLRARALALRRRAAFEHVIAENSTRLINCPPTKPTRGCKQVLSELCRAIGAERAYVVLDEKPTRVHAWSAVGEAYPSGLALSGADTLRAIPHGLQRYRYHPGCRRSAARSTQDMLAAVGVRSWTCVPLILPGLVHGIISSMPSVRSLHSVFPLPCCGSPATLSPTPSSASFSSATERTYNAAGTRTPHANDRIAGKRDCA